MHLLYLKKLQSSQHLRNHKMPRHCYSHKYFSTFVKFDISSSFSQQRESQSQRYEDGKKVYDSSMSKSRYVLVVAFIMPKIFQKAPICVPSLFSDHVSNPFCIYLFSHTPHFSILWCQYLTDIPINWPCISNRCRLTIVSYTSKCTYQHYHNIR